MTNAMDTANYTQNLMETSASDIITNVRILEYSMKNV